MYFAKPHDVPFTLTDSIHLAEIPIPSNVTISDELWKLVTTKNFQNLIDQKAGEVPVINPYMYGRIKINSKFKIFQDWIDIMPTGRMLRNSLMQASRTEIYECFDVEDLAEAVGPIGKRTTLAKFKEASGFTQVPWKGARFTFHNNHLVVDFEDPNIIEYEIPIDEYLHNENSLFHSITKPLRKQVNPPVLQLIAFLNPKLSATLSVKSKKTEQISIARWYSISTDDDGTKSITGVCYSLAKAENKETFPLYTPMEFGSILHLASQLHYTGKSFVKEHAFRLDEVHNKLDTVSIEGTKARHPGARRDGTPWDTNPEVPKEVHIDDNR